MKRILDYTLLVALFALTVLYHPYVRSDSLGECIEKSRIAVQVAQALDQGFTLEQINFTYPMARSPAEVAAADKVVAEIKLSVAQHYAKLDGRDQRVDRAAQAYLEECAYNYGKQFRKTGSADHKQAECIGWGLFAARAMALKSKGVAEPHVLLILDNLVELDGATMMKVKRAVAEAYAWPRDPETLQQHIVGECTRGWPSLTQSSFHKTDHVITDKRSHDRPAASSQAIQDKEARESRCNEALLDERYILFLHQRVADFGAIRYRASMAANSLGLQRYEKILKLIDEAEKSGNVAEWYNKKREACIGQQT